MLILDQETARLLQAHGEEGYPDEICGLLTGNFEQGMEIRRVREAHRVRNLNRERAADRYDLDPADYRTIEEEARRRRMEVVGVYHSHPDHPSQPSETDRLRAEGIWQADESWSYLILEIAVGRLGSWRSWVLRNRVFHQEGIKIGSAQVRGG